MERGATERGWGKRGKGVRDKQGDKVEMRTKREGEGGGRALTRPKIMQNEKGSK